VRFLRWLVVAAVCGGALASSVPPAEVPTLRVAGRAVVVNGPTTVADALRKARVVVPAGRVLSLVTRRPIRGDHQPGQVLLDGVPTAADTTVAPGAVLTVVPGKDVTEPVEVVTEPVPANHGVASLFVGATPGTARVVRGTLSGETTSPRVLVAPRGGHLVAPGAYALTFDDGPDPVWTPVVLTFLRQAHLHATFCLVGRQAARYPALVRAIVAGGHSLCNHSWSHDEQLATRSPEVIRSEIARTQDAVRRAAGVTPRLFRAPGGVWSAGLVAEARRQGMSALEWTVDPRDWARPGTPAIVRALLQGIRPGAVVLLHDGGGDRSQTVLALQAVLVPLQKRHLVAALPQP
jgi:peptidoglycan/xylan/chitin deacetylase (PgdA/CDA1 family)